MPFSFVLPHVLTRPRSYDNELRSALPFVVAIVLALLIEGPWLWPGYLFGTDWPAPRRFDLPAELSNSAPLQVALAGVSWAFGSETTGKILVFAILIGGALAAYCAVPTAGFVGRTAAATLFIANPFVFGRLHYGQLYIVGAYAVLP